MKTSTFFLALLLLCSACKKEEEVPTAPVLTYKSISETEVEQFNNSITVSFEYEDHQGDLGESDPDMYSLRVRDARLPGDDWFHIPPMTPDNKELHIKGIYNLELDPLFILGNGAQEQTSFEIQVKDRAGNWSNTVKTPNVLIVDSL